MNSTEIMFSTLNPNQPVLIKLSMWDKCIPAKVVWGEYCYYPPFIVGESEVYNV